VTNVTINIWDTDHPHRATLSTLIDHLGQTNWVNFHAEWHLDSVMLVAHNNNEPLGFLRYVIQEIGTDSDLEPIRINNKILRESKVIAFGVNETMRRQGIGRQLQQALIEHSRQAGCYQIRSHSSLENKANHHLKLSMGYAVHPLVSSQRKDGFYFVLPL
jgi:GNAT superfamily N-acetyltransferase